MCLNIVHLFLYCTTESWCFGTLVEVNQISKVRQPSMPYVHREVLSLSVLGGSIDEVLLFCL